MARCGTGSRALLAALVAAALAVLVPALSGCAADPDPIAAAQAPSGSGLDLASAPWVDMPQGANSVGTAPEWPSLRFAPGVTYAGALTRLYVAARTGASRVEDAEVAAPLPREVVYVAPATDADGLQLSLLAPWGWTGSDGAIRPPSINMPGTLPPDEVMRRFREAQAEGRPLPEGARIDVPQLPACQVAQGTPDQRPPC
ncbi:MAG: hypothetical protein AB7O78_07400 [Thermoleophilia bacterium]